MTRCGFCDRRVEESEAEYCWYCGGRLCGLCWEEVGHCGHPEADEINRKTRRDIAFNATEYR